MATESHVDNFSIHGNSVKQVFDVPMSVINRPIPSQLDKEKVENMKTILQIPERENELTPIDVHHVKHKGQDYYFAFGGCHRWEANKELKRETIKAKLIETPASVIKTYLGSSSPFKD
ncbi:ParB/Sulfiredoxin [Mucor mucedo]|nr:ParB/Sulfiredoxin [Mucor mucedo]KAI7892203.1 ParB/Sulfiredoxin [Mucor mucedo]